MLGAKLERPSAIAVASRLGMERVLNRPPRDYSLKKGNVCQCLVLIPSISYPFYYSSVKK